jgi:hypothetical protein
MTFVSAEPAHSLLFPVRDMNSLLRQNEILFRPTREFESNMLESQREPSATSAGGAKKARIP